MPENITITVDDTTEDVTLFVAAGGGVDSVFGRAGLVVAVAGDYDTDEVTEATNLYYTDARVSANTDVAANTAKTGITAQQATDITTNNAKVTFPEAPNDGTQYARKSLGWEAVAGGGDYADGGEAGGADRTLGNTDNFSLGFLVNNLKALLLKPITTAVNWLAISPSVTGSGVTLEAEGTDTNIDINITPKGSGTAVIEAGADSTGATALKVIPVQGGSFPDSYVNILDSGKIDAFSDRTNYSWSLDGADLKLHTDVGLSYAFPYLKVNIYDYIAFSSKRDISAGDYFRVNNLAGHAMTDANGEQSYLAVTPLIEQSGTAAYNGIKVDVTETTLGDGSTGDGNNLLNLAVGGVSKARIDNTGAIFSSGTPAYADEAAAVTAGLATGDIYQTTGTAASPLNVAGILMIKQ